MTLYFFVQQIVLWSLNENSTGTSLTLNFNKSKFRISSSIFSCYHGFIGLKSLKLQCVTQLKHNSEILSSKFAKTANLCNLWKIYFTTQLAETGLTSYVAVMFYLLIQSLYK